MILTPSSLCSPAPATCESPVHGCGTRQQISGERKTPLYDQKAHPMDEQVNPRKFKAYRDRHGLEPIIANSDALEELYIERSEDGITCSSSAQADETDGSEYSGDKTIGRSLKRSRMGHPIDLDASRTSRRLQEQSRVVRPLYNMKIHPNDVQLDEAERAMRGRPVKKQKVRETEESEAEAEDLRSPPPTRSIAIFSDAHSSYEWPPNPEICNTRGFDAEIPDSETHLSDELTDEYDLPFLNTRNMTRSPSTQPSFDRLRCPTARQIDSSDDETSNLDVSFSEVDCVNPEQLLRHAGNTVGAEPRFCQSDERDLSCAIQSPRSNVDEQDYCQAILSELQEHS